MSIQRFNFYAIGYEGDGEMESDPEGEYIYFSDFEAHIAKGRELADRLELTLFAKYDDSIQATLVYLRSQP